MPASLEKGRSAELILCVPVLQNSVYRSGFLCHLSQGDNQKGPVGHRDQSSKLIYFKQVCEILSE